MKIVKFYNFKPSEKRWNTFHGIIALGPSKFLSDLTPPVPPSALLLWLLGPNTGHWSEHRGQVHLFLETWKSSPPKMNGSDWIGTPPPPISCHTQSPLSFPPVNSMEGNQFFRIWAQKFLYGNGIVWRSETLHSMGPWTSSQYKYLCYWWSL